MSSKAVVPTGGPSGSVTTGLVFPFHLGGRRADFCSWQVYSLTRMAGLATVIMNLILLNTTAIINCQVCATSHVCLLIPVLTCRLQVSAILEMVSNLFKWAAVSEERTLNAILSHHSSTSFPPTWPFLLLLFCLCSARASSIPLQLNTLSEMDTYVGCQNRNLEEKHGCGGNRDHYMGGQRCIPYPR